MARLLGLLSFVLPVILSGTLVSADDESVKVHTVDEIWKQLADRQKSIDSGEVRFRARHWNLYEDLEQTNSVQATSRAAKSPTWTDWNECQVWFSGEMVRFEQSIASFAEGAKGQLVPQANAFDGKRMRMLTTHRRPDLDDSGSVAAASAFRQWDYADLLALWLVFRPLRPEVLGDDPGPWMLDPHPVEIRGIRCVEVVRTQPTKEVALETRVAFDVSNGLRPIRYSFGQVGKPLVVIDMEYESGDSRESVHVPSKWTYAAHRPVSGKLASSGEFEAVSVFLNPEIPEERFRVAFPAGARVTDEDQQQTYIVQDNGDWLPDNPSLATATGATPGWRSPTAIFLVVIIVMFVFAAALLLRWRSACRMRVQ